MKFSDGESERGERTGRKRHRDKVKAIAGEGKKRQKRKTPANSSFNTNYDREQWMPILSMEH
jgi:hypothetical protein